MRAFFLSFCWLFISTLAFGQQGTLTGKVTDKKTGEGVIGANVVVAGTVQAAPVGVDGSYELPLPAGTYTINITNVGYKQMSFPGIVVTSGAKTTLNAVMAEDATSLSEVTVTGVKQTGTEVALIQDLKKSEVVVSGMSNDQIVKTLDRDAAEVVKRIPGVTVQSNNFIVIRGLAERYNTVLLNDALTPSAEVDTRSFSFDILPSSVIDRVLIFKSGAPELPGEFGGGVVKVYTKNSVLENSTTFSVSGWARNGTTFKNGYQQSSRSSTDFLGFDNGLRKMPGAIDDQPYVTNTDLTPEQLKQAGSSLRNEWKPTLSKAAPDLRASLGLTRKFELGSVYLSNVTSISYANTHEQYDVTRQRFETGSGNFIFNYNDLRSQTGTRLGIIHNWQLRLNDHNRVEFRNFLNQYGTDEVIHRTGLDNAQGGDGVERDNYALHYQSRTIYSGQLDGNHDVGKAKSTTLNWQTGYNYVFRNEPDYRRFRTERVFGSTDPFVVTTSPNGNQYDGSSYFSKLNENTYMLSGQLEKRLRGRDTTQVNQYKLRAGFYTEYKERTYDSRYFSYVSGGDDFDRAKYASLPIEQIFSPENLDPVTGFRLQEGTDATGNDQYRANNTLLAGYLSAVAPISDKFNISGGVRAEYNRKFLRKGDDTSTNLPYEEKKLLFLPSINSTYNFNDRSLLRLAAAETVNRPEFREVAEYSYYDFANNANIKGNANLRTARIYNADLRYEFYPSRSELLSVGIFYKKFKDAIEQVTAVATGNSLELGYSNAAQAYDVGVEVEARKSLVGLTQSAFLQRFQFVLNASFIKSRVTLNDTSGTGTDNNRPLQGQSPYVVNAGVFYQDDARQWQVSAQYNVIGPRILFASSNPQNYTIFDMPRHVVDLAVTKGFGPHLDVRVGIQDLLNQYTRQYYDLDRNGNVSGNETGAFGLYRRGQYSTVGVTYKF
jgi:outer membrane receptor protein involved in Fe transport